MRICAPRSMSRKLSFSCVTRKNRTARTQATPKTHQQTMGLTDSILLPRNPPRPVTVTFLSLTLSRQGTHQGPSGKEEVPRTKCQIGLFCACTTVCGHCRSHGRAGLDRKQHRQHARPCGTVILYIFHVPEVEAWRLLVARHEPSGTSHAVALLGKTLCAS